LKSILGGINGKFLRSQKILKSLCFFDPGRRSDKCFFHPPIFQAKLRSFLCCCREVAYREVDFDSLEFIAAHELGHIKAGHVTLLYNLLIFPVTFVPVLNNLLWNALSRAREYTAERIAINVDLSGKKGLIVLSEGKYLYKNINYDDYLETAKASEEFWIWSTNLLSDHLVLVRRIRAINESKTRRIF
jgi:Zn-dependent protease with chaperone function